MYRDLSANKKISALAEIKLFSILLISCLDHKKIKGNGLGRISFIDYLQAVPGPGASASIGSSSNFV